MNKDKRKKIKPISYLIQINIKYLAQPNLTCYTYIN